MTNNSVWPSPDTQVAQQGRSDVHGVYLLDPVTQKAVAPIGCIAVSGYVAAYGSNAAALTANTDYLFKWGAAGVTQVNHIMIQNNFTVNLLFDLDVATSAGSPILIFTPPGNTLFLDVQTTVLHMQANGTPNVNGTSSGNIVVRGWL